MNNVYPKGLVILLVALLTAAPALAQDRSAGDTAQRLERLERLERLVESQGLADILMRLNNLEQEVRELRGQNEEQTHTIEELKQRQRELYIDLDRRLLQVERGTTADSSGTVSDSTDKPASPSSPGRPTGKPTVSTGAGKLNRPPANADEVPTSARKTEQEAYQEAFNLLRELEYDKAVKSFRSFLQDYPDGRYAHIARYWLGEANYAQRNFKQAIEDYQSLIARYPNSPKVAEAMLKIGYSHHRLEAYKPARDILEKLVAEYPGTTEASQARNLLQKIRAKLSGG